MSYRVLIPTAGIGSRLGKLTNHINKSLVSISHRPIISHLIEQFPKNCEFVIALGYKGNLVKNFLELAYPKREFLFVNVDIYKGEKSGLGHSLLCCEKHLQQPFVFISCDTLVKGSIPEPNCNWMGFSEIKDVSKYRSLSIKNGTVLQIHEKGEIYANSRPYIGMAGIKNYKLFWNEMYIGKSDSINQGEVYGMRSILKTNKIFAENFKWFDTGNIAAISRARKEYYEPNGPNILEKDDEAIWFVDKNVIKFAVNHKFICDRIKRAKELEGYVPNIISHKSNMYCYKKVKGKVISDVIDLPIFEEFLLICKTFWLKKKLSISMREKFKNDCMGFYKNKSLDRINLFYKNFNKNDNADFINGEKMPSLSNLLNQIDWDWISKGLAGRFHGDFHFENILYSQEKNYFIFLDWRQDFAGDLSVGDIYYDLAKLMHGLIVNHGIIANNQYFASWENNKINYDFNRKQILVECEERLKGWIKENNYDLKKVLILTGLIFLNIAALHHYPYSLLLYGLGKKMIRSELK